MAKREKKRGVRQIVKKEKTEIFDLSQETRNSIWGIASFALAVISILAFFHRAGTAGDLFSKISKSLFGWGIFLVPLGLALLGFSFLKSISRKIYTSAILGTTLFVLAFLGLFFIVGSENIGGRVEQAGYLGVILGLPTFKALGFTASFVTLLSLIFVSLLISLNIPVYKIIGKDPKTDGEGSEDYKKPLKDNVVIKRGDEILDSKEETKKSKFSATVTAVSKKPQSEEEKEFVIKTSKSGKWITPPFELLHSDNEHPKSGDISSNVNVIKRTLSNFGIDVEMGEVSIGPTVTQYTLRPAMGVKLSKITTLQSDLSLALAAHPIRVEAPIPGKSLVGIEVPNKKSALVGLRDLIDNDDFKKSRYFLPLVLGRDVAGFPVYAGLEKMPHLLIAGATGTGKSVSINTILLSLLYKHSPDILKLILVDPKRVELSLYNGIPHLVTPVIVDTKKVVYALRWAVKEMEHRYELISQVGARDIFSYNIKKAVEKESLMPFIVIVIDELADLMASYGRDVEGAIVRLAQMSRAVGIHLIVSTQRPAVEVITGLIKANITSRVAFQVASGIDSRTILDNSGADRLLGNGDMLFQAGDVAKPRRIQGSFVTEKEVKDVVKFIKTQAEKTESDEELGEELKVDLNEISLAGGIEEGDDFMDDTLYEEAKKVVIEARKASASLLQRRLRVGYARAARLIDLLEEKGIVGPGDGAKPREIYSGIEKDDGAVAKEVEDGSIEEI